MKRKNSLKNMVGHYQSEAETHAQSLLEWILDSIREKRWERHDDLHIDQVASFYRSKENWVEGALELWRFALKIVPSTKHTIMLSIPLALQKNHYNSENVTKAYVKSKLGQTPPSICVYQVDFEIFNSFAQGYPEIRFDALPDGFSCYFEQREIESGVYFQCLFFKPQNERNVL